MRGNLIAQLIDELPLLAVVGTQVPGGIEIRDAAELRRKETRPHLDYSKKSAGDGS